MAAYTIQQFITQAEAGGAVSISAATYSFNSIIDGNPFTIGTTSIDIGKYFSARQILECYAIRAGIVDGSLRAEAGTVTLSVDFKR